MPGYVFYKHVQYSILILVELWSRPESGLQTDGTQTPGKYPIVWLNDSWKKPVSIEPAVRFQMNDIPWMIVHMFYIFLTGDSQDPLFIGVSSKDTIVLEYNLLRVRSSTASYGVSR